MVVLVSASCICYLTRNVGWPCGLVRVLVSQALEKKSLDMVRLLKEKYAATLKRDESFLAYWSKMEGAFFQLPASSAGGGLGGILGGLLKSLTELEDFDDEEDDAHQ